MPTPDLFSPDGQRLLLASDDFSARLWLADSGKPMAERVLHRAAITACGFCLDGKRFFTASEDGTVRLGDGSNGQDLGALAKHGAAITGAVADAGVPGWLDVRHAHHRAIAREIGCHPTASQTRKTSTASRPR